MRIVIASLLTALVAPALVGCLTVQPRVAAPLPDDGLAVGVGASAGATPSIGWIGGVATAAAGPSVAWQALKGEHFSLEIDGSAGAGVINYYSDYAFVGALLGARAWLHTSKRTSFGIDGAVTGAYAVESIRDPVNHGPDFAGQVEARMLASTQLIDDVLWLGTRPGVIVLVEDGHDFGQNVPVFIDTPVSLTLQIARVRLGAELGLAGYWLLPVPLGLHAGVTAAVVF